MVGVLGYGALAYISRGSLGEPELVAFFALTGWVSLPWIVVFACFHRAGAPEALPVGRLLFWAVLFRVCGLFGVPLFEDDYFRYLWDGFRFAETGTPYGTAPAAFFANTDIPLVFQRILDHINYPDLPTIYGPLTELLFLLAYVLEPGSLMPLQALLIGVDILLIRLLLTVAPATHVLLYAWCPLVIKEIAFTAHPDGLGVSLAIAAVVLGSRRHAVGAAVCIALAVGAKVFALLLVPFVLARAGPRAWLAFVAVLALLYLPFAIRGDTDLQVLGLFAATWEFNSALYGLLTRWLAPALTKWLLGTALVALGAAYWLRYRSDTPGQIPRGDWIYGAFLVAAPVINPWYALWLLPFAVIYPSRWAWTASVALFLSYVTAINMGSFHLDPFALPFWVRPVEFGLILGALGIDVWRDRS